MKPLRVAVIDYQSGNLRSVSRALARAGAEPVVTGDPQVLLRSPAAVLPGVGAGDAAMRSLQQRGLVGPVREYVGSGRPFLGVCLGLQLLMDSTEEGGAPCLGLVAGVTRKLPGGLKVPHMGWNQVALRSSHPLLEGVPGNSHFYFVHSYYAQPEDEGLVVGVTEYGVQFCSIIARDNLIATQFHPEKSGALGLRVYENFVRYACRQEPGGR
jgi:glutamine amidotransferase